MKSCISGQHDILVLGNVPPPGNEKVVFQVNMTFDSGNVLPLEMKRLDFRSVSLFGSGQCLEMKKLDFRSM